ncbi:PTS system unknown substrate IIA component, Fru family (TC 4.A.2.1.9) [Propionispira arboris]|uniref:PTS EIIA type-2 domain-containing protein n=1 Tax=Propionispira arboris TaxID=84035 RepID=A0A1H6Z2W4_9FIRM|nr:PTS sugar transporter subunit IIA [Propionispira arboris]SEJ47923.1 PTS system unknown substrate IIA component, Fru family (TC 4.A.2.1.9) [Propionispira arboris]
MNIETILNKNLINLNMQANTKDEAIKELTDLLYKAGNVKDEDAFIKDVYNREAEGKTGLGNHIAIPHGKSDAVNVTSIAVGRTKNDLIWESYDNLPVHVVILFAVRNVDKTTVHLKLLSQVAIALSDEEIFDKLLTTNDKGEVIYLLSNKIQ